MKLKTQLLTNNLLLFAIVLFVSSVMYGSISALDKSAAMVTHTDRVIREAQHLQTYMSDMETGQRGFLLTGDEEFLEPYNKGISSFKEAMDTAIHLTSDNPAQGVQLGRIERLYERWLDEAGEVEIALRRDVDNGIIDQQVLVNALLGLRADGSPLPESIETGKQLMDMIRVQLEILVQAELTLLKGREEESQQASSFGKTVGLLASICAGLLAILLSYLITKRIYRILGAEPTDLQVVAHHISKGVLTELVTVAGNARGDNLATHLNEVVESLRETAKDVEKITRGELSEPRLSSEKDELGLALVRMTERLGEVTSENERVRWLKTGQNSLTDIIRGSQDIETLAKATITQLAKYLGAQVGAIYTSEIDHDPDDKQDSEPLLTLTGSYAFKYRKSSRTRIRLGEGLVGQAALEQEVIVLSNVPQDYLQIQSGLGGTDAVNVIVVPVILNNKVKAVLELGSIEPFTPVQIELLDLVTENIAISIHAAQDRQKMQGLLGETMRQAGELQLQQSELQQANSELEDQAASLKESEERLQASNGKLEISAKYLEQQSKNVQYQKEILEGQKRELRQSNKYKTEFLSNMSHELRTPLNSILILSNSLAENEAGNLSEDEVQAARIVNSGGNELLQLINEILDLSKIDAGKMDVIKEEFRVRDLASGMIDQLAPIAKEKDLELYYTMAEGDVKLTTDNHRVRQILKNMISNALKFTEAGSVCLSIGAPNPDLDSLVLKKAKKNKTTVLAFSVVDTGPGICEERQQAIFEAFQQEDGSTSRSYGGTGLGLTISRRLAELLGGDLLLESSDSSGSTFTLLLPEATVEASLSPATTRPAVVKRAPAVPNAVRPVVVESTAPASQEKPLAGFQVLLVDDDHRNLFAVGTALAAAGAIVEQATGGSLAVEKARTDPFDIILMDLMMPEMDGYEATGLIRELEGLSDIPIVAVTAKAMPQVRKKCLGSGFSEYMAKPIDMNELIQLMLSLLPSAGDGSELKDAG